VIGRRLKVSGDIQAAAAQAPKMPAVKKARARAETDEEPSEPQAVQKREKPADTHYVVKKGDTLEKIASRNNTTIAALRKLNNMKKGDSLQAGSRIRVAAEQAGREPELESRSLKTETAKSGKKAVKPKKGDKKDYSIHVVKKGETLEKIAAKNNTTIAALLKMNDMKMRDPLLTGKKLKVPTEE
jgi:N-acetylmuramoyl-L-alanine amidase